jgi:hypothetical protein
MAKPYKMGIRPTSELRLDALKDTPSLGTLDGRKRKSTARTPGSLFKGTLNSSLRHSPEAISSS